jgi:pyruvate/2-oxoglutarate/acetoin dehydrogenase E1 component
MPWAKIYPDYSQFKRACKKAKKKLRGLTFGEAMQEAIRQGMKQDPKTIIFGEGVDDPKGIFGTTLKLDKIFGKSRCFDTPISENALSGIALGASLVGLRPILVHMRMDFLMPAMDQMVNHLAKWSYMSGGRIKTPLIIRSLIGRGWGSAAQHSQCLHALFAHVPGIKVVMPSCPYDAKGLFLSSLKERCPVLFLEYRWLYKHVGFVPKKPYLVPLGEACVKKQGKDITLVALSYLVSESLKAAYALQKEGIDAEVIDLRTVTPWDKKTIIDSVKKTRRLLVVDPGHISFGVSAEIIATLSKEAFRYLDSPCERIALPDTPTPSSPALEGIYYPDHKSIARKIKKYYRK